MALKPEDYQALGEYIEVDKFETIEEAKKFFDETFGRKEAIKRELSKDSEFINSITGKRLGSIETKAKTFGKELGLDLDGEEVKGKPAEELVEMIWNKAKAKHKEDLDSLQKSLGDPTEAIKEWETKYNTAKKEASKWKGEFETLGSTFETYKTELSTKMRQDKLNKHIETMFAGIPFAEEAIKDELKMVGFKTKITSEVNFDLDEQDNFILLGKDKMPITNPAKAGATYSPDDYVKEQAIKLGMFKLNDKGGEKVTQTFKPYEPAPDTNNIPLKRVHPSAQQAAG